MLEQRGSEKYGKCMRLFKSKGGLAVHRCSTSVLQEELESQSNVQSISRTTAQTVKCSVCGRGFNRDLKKHKCKDEREKIIQEQKGAVQCERCYRWFRNKGGLTVYKCNQTRPSACHRW